MKEKFIKHIFAFSSIILINELAYQLDCSVDNIILGFKGLSEQITLYQLALIIVTAISNCTSMVYTPFIPTVYSNEANGNREANLKLYDLITFIQLLLWFFVFGGFLACGKEFVIIWIGRERLIVFYICLSLLIIRSLSCCQGPSKDMMRASGKHLHRAILAMVAAILNSLVSFILVYFVFDDSNAIWGCIIGTATASVICWCIICNFMSYKYLKINIKLYCCNFLLLCLLSFVCALIPIVLKTYVFSHWINNTTLTFLISGFIFVFLFLGLCILLFKKRIKEIYFLLRSK